MKKKIYLYRCHACDTCLLNKRSLEIVVHMLKGRSFNKEYLKVFQSDVTIVVCQGRKLKTEDAQHIARDVINVTRETTLQWFVEQGVI